MTPAEKRRRTGEALIRVSEHLGYQAPEHTWRQIRQGLSDDDRTFVEEVVFLYLAKSDLVVALSQLTRALAAYDAREQAARTDHPVVGTILETFEGSRVVSRERKEPVCTHCKLPRDKAGDTCPQGIYGAHHFER